MKKPSNVTFVLDTFPSLTETFILNQIVSLIEKGYQVNILAKNQKKNIPIHQKIIEYNLLSFTHYYTYPNRRWIKRLFISLYLYAKNFTKINHKILLKLIVKKFLHKDLFDLSLFYKAQWIINKKIKSDLYHIHFGQNSIDIAEFKKLKLINTPFVLTFHGFDLKPLAKKQNFIRYKNSFEEAAAITVNTPYLASILYSTHELINKDKVYILPVGLDTTSFLSINTEDKDVFKLIFCGRLIPLKGPDVLIKILNELVNNRRITNLELTIIGSGDMIFKVKQLISDFKLEKQVFIYEKAKQEFVFQKMIESDVFVLPGIEDDEKRAETQGLVIQEAQSCKLPVIVSDAGGMKYGLINEVTGFVLEQKDIIGFANKIEFLMNNPKKRKEMGEKGREFVMENYDNKILVDKLEKIYFSCYQT